MKSSLDASALTRHKSSANHSWSAASLDNTPNPCGPHNTCRNFNQWEAYYFTYRMSSIAIYTWESVRGSKMRLKPSFTTLSSNNNNNPQPRRMMIYRWYWNTPRKTNSSHCRQTENIYMAIPGLQNQMAENEKMISFRSFALRSEPIAPMLDNDLQQELESNSHGFLEQHPNCNISSMYWWFYYPGSCNKPFQIRRITCEWHADIDASSQISEVHSRENKIVLNNSFKAWHSSWNLRRDFNHIQMHPVLKYGMCTLYIPLVERTNLLVTLLHVVNPIQ